MSTHAMKWHQVRQSYCSSPDSGARAFLSLHGPWPWCFSTAAIFDAQVSGVHVFRKESDSHLMVLCIPSLWSPHGACFLIP